jgi:hypothetical protein
LPMLSHGRRDRETSFVVRTVKIYKMFTSKPFNTTHFIVHC